MYSGAEIEDCGVVGGKDEGWKKHGEGVRKEFGDGGM